MSGFFGGKGNANATPKYTGLTMQTSALGLPIQIVWGKKRIAPNLLWYGDFVAKPAGGKKGGGKGGDGKGAAVYDYTCAVILGLCEGPISGIGTVWADKNIVTLSSLGLTLFTGSATQGAWSYLTSNHPSQAISYSGTAYLANSAYTLGKSPNLPNHNFEVITPLSGSMPGTVDVNMADVISDLLGNPQYGFAQLSGAIDPTSWAAYKTYCQAQGLFFSPDLGSQEQLAQVLDRWANLTNAWFFWSGNVMKVVPLGDSAITANGVTYTPAASPVFNLTVDDFVVDGSNPPVTVTRTDPADVVNRVRIEIKDRGNNYGPSPIQWQDQALIDQFGAIDHTVTQAHEICDPAVAALVAQLMGQRAAYIRNEYAFRLQPSYCVLEPGDIVTLTLANPPLTNFPVRIKTLEEDDKGIWTVTTEEYPGTVGTSAAPLVPQATTNTVVNQNVAPGSVNPPCIFEPASNLTNRQAQVWIAASGGANWGGCLVYLSFDNVNFNPIGSITAPAPQGVLTANLPAHADPDTVDTLSVDLTESVSVLQTDATHADADALRTLSRITASFTTSVPSGGDNLAYGSVTLTGSYAFNLSYLRRGAYGSAPAAHSTGDFFTRINLDATQLPGNSVLVYDLPVAYIGATLYFKFVSFNRFGNAAQDISTVPTYTYTPSGLGYGGGVGGVPTTPTGLTAAGGTNQNVLSWNANPATDNVTSYRVYGAAGSGVAFASCALLATVSGLSWTHTGLGSSATWTYYLEAVNAVGASLPEGPVNAATSASSNLWNPCLSLYDRLPDAGETLMTIVMSYATSLPANLTGSYGGVDGTAATANAAFTLYKNGISIGTATIPASTTGRSVATFSFSSTVTFAAGDTFEVAAPATQDTTLKGFFFSFLGSR